MLKVKCFKHSDNDKLGCDTSDANKEIDILRQAFQHIWEACYSTNGTHSN